MVSEWQPPRLHLPPYEFKHRNAAGRHEVLDPHRQRWVVLTPEEWVRLHVVQFLVNERGVPPGLLAVESALRYEGLLRRADIVVFDRTGQPVLVVECKAPTVSLDQSVLDQVARYNYELGARHVLVTNGRDHFVIRYDGESHRFLDDLPAYSALL